MKIEIKNRWDGTVIYSHECENNTIAITVMKANSEDVSLRESDLKNCDLSDSDLSNCDLSNSDLKNCDLSDSDLSNCDLSNSDLSDSDLSYCYSSNSDSSNCDFSNCKLVDSGLYNCKLNGSNFSNCNLTGCYFSNCDLSNTNFSNSNLFGINLNNSNLNNCDLTPIRDDIWSILASVPKEVSGLILAIKEGRIDGSTYTGECACLVGTIANIKHVDNYSISKLFPDSSRPAERFFLGIKKGDKPETSQFSALALQWCEEWLNLMQEAFKQTT